MSERHCKLAIQAQPLKNLSGGGNEVNYAAVVNDPDELGCLPALPESWHLQHSTSSQQSPRDDGASCRKEGDFGENITNTTATGPASTLSLQSSRDDGASRRKEGDFGRNITNTTTTGPASTSSLQSPRDDGTSFLEEGEFYAHLQLRKRER